MSRRERVAGALVPHKPFLTATFIMYGPTRPSFRNLLVLYYKCRKLRRWEEIWRITHFKLCLIATCIAIIYKSHPNIPNFVIFARLEQPTTRKLLPRESLGEKCCPRLKRGKGSRSRLSWGEKLVHVCVTSVMCYLILHRRSYPQDALVSW